MKELFRLRVSDIAKASGEPIPDSDLVVTRASSLHNIHKNSILFVKKLTEGNMASAKSASDCLILIPDDTPADLVDAMGDHNVIAQVPNPRLSYAKVMTAALKSVLVRCQYTNRNGAFVADDAVIGEGTVIEPGAFVDHSVVMGSNVRVHTGAVIRSFSEIGDNTIIRENAVIGSEGFGFERDLEGTPVRLPHLGGVRIGRNVEIGVFTAVCAGTIDPTVIEDDVKVDNLVHIAHNCVVEKGAMVIACAELSGSVRVGQRSWVGPNASVIESRRIGDGATVGIAAVVIRDVEPGAIVAGNPAKPTAEITKVNRAIARLVAEEDER
jgi:UDP-3-O-[3-hydroxymyristoyl] glucosamine N-acyltransferase